MRHRTIIEPFRLKSWEPTGINPAQLNFFEINKRTEHARRVAAATDARDPHVR